MQNQEVRESARSVVIVAPIWLQNVLSLWLQADGKMMWVICATTFEALPFGAGPKSEPGKLAYLVPDLVIFFAPPALAVEQVEKIKQIWPTTTLLVLADAGQTELRAAGADVVLPKEFSPEQFLNVVAGLAQAA